MSKLLQCVVVLVVTLANASSPSAESSSATATVHVSATIGPGSVEVSVEDGWARWEAFHLPEGEAAMAVTFTLPDGTRLDGSRWPAGAWAQLWTDEGPTRLALGKDVPFVQVLVSRR